MKMDCLLILLILGFASAQTINFDLYSLPYRNTALQYRQNIQPAIDFNQDDGQYQKLNSLINRYNQIFKNTNYLQPINQVQSPSNYLYGNYNGIFDNNNALDGQNNRIYNGNKNTFGGI